VKPSEKLLRRLREETDLYIPQDAVLLRQHPSRPQRDEGGWSWFMWSDKEGVPNLTGSQFPMTDCANAEALVVDTDRWGDHHVYPDPEPKTEHR
jgi:hypothetical protein